MADRQYELVYILPPDTTEQQVTDLQTQVEGVVSKMHGHIEIDVSELMLHQGVRVRDVPIDPRWKPLTEADAMLVHIILPKAEEAPAAADVAAAATATPAEPEVLKKGKKEEEEEKKEDKKKEDKKK